MVPTYPYVFIESPQILGKRTLLPRGSHRTPEIAEETWASHPVLRPKMRCWGAQFRCKARLWGFFHKRSGAKIAQDQYFSGTLEVQLLNSVATMLQLYSMPVAMQRQSSATYAPTLREEAATLLAPSPGRHPLEPLKGCRCGVLLPFFASIESIIRP